MNQYETQHDAIKRQLDATLTEINGQPTEAPEKLVLTVMQMILDAELTVIHSIKEDSHDQN